MDSIARIKEHHDADEQHAIFLKELKNALMAVFWSTKAF